MGFARGMAALLRSRGFEALNVSIRHSPPDRVSLLLRAREEVFSFAPYCKQRTWARRRERVASWTRELIDLALRQGGRYYLPYQLHTTADQFAHAYPEVEEFRCIDCTVDPAGRFFNELWRKYL